MEILLRLPPQPSSLPRASLVCKRWRRLVSDPGFFRLFREHRGKPPLLGFFCCRYLCGTEFTPMMEPPNRIPAARFSLPLPEDGHGRWAFVDCRHGLALLLDRTRRKCLVWDPTTGHQRQVAFPPGFISDQEKLVQNAAVLCPVGGHVRGDCHWRPFKLVLVRHNHDQTLAILEFDVVRQGLAVIAKLADSHDRRHSLHFQTVQIEESGLGLAALTGSKSSIIQIWARKINYDGVFRWVLQKTVELDKLLPLGPSMKKPEISFIRGFDEVTNAIILSMVDGVGVMIQLESLKFRNLCTPSCTAYYPYRNFCTAGLFKGKLQEDIQAGADHVQQEESSESSKD
ncbi:hypothetical protein BRADI_3g38708v3 [Brachypodium distachyon]|uniref:F-box domain-containing protein n=1 Tax=Brachypodium distachyon TaxID=15368 RepID=A0A0Q3IDW1_BRADI|nr:hypothetical protein BRADI_3g38708v3 [Brachypodium distachyon]